LPFSRTVRGFGDTRNRNRLPGLASCRAAPPTRAVTDATLPFVPRLANLDAALEATRAWPEGLNTHAGTLTHDGVVETLAGPITRPTAQRNTTQ
jgi:alanine dehydrogenase